VPDRNSGLSTVGVVITVLAVALVGAMLVSVAGSGDEREDRLTGVERVQGLLDGVPQRNFTLGDEAAPNVLVLYTDAFCVGCRPFYANVLPTVVRRYVRTGRLRVIARPVTTPRSPQLGLREAFAATLQDRLWHFLLLFDANSDVTLEPLRVARMVPGLDVERLRRDVRSPRVARAAERAEERRARIDAAVPSLYVDPAGRGAADVRRVNLGQPRDAMLEQIVRAVEGAADAPGPAT
jgi:hypothetical protein